jgi:hypothetical protein
MREMPNKTYTSFVNERDSSDRFMNKYKRRIK